MAYSNFAYYYDDLNQAADYNALFCQVLAALRAQGIHNGIVADLGCGTGEMSIMLAAAGYDMIAIDASEDMLMVAREKAEEAGRGNILFLQQNLAELDLYGTIRAAVATFDTVNHLPPVALAAAVQKIALFMEAGGVFVFDANTPYKHCEILGNNAFTVETEDGLCCHWQNKYLPEIPATEISVCVSDAGETVCTERFLEYSYTLQELEEILVQNKFKIKTITDGENFGPVANTSQRILITAVKMG
ncbi:methyltransferase domain-containing protein [Ruminococcaceae bacterium OttesenSCG-928-A16]|nr:methyltransferase domain-containing protein [Ruminococcaceae bacterium OttesenSCG-928-A16]